MRIIFAWLVILGFAAGAADAPVNTIATLDQLLTRIPDFQETLLITGRHTTNEWGEGRFVKHVPGSSLTTNQGNVFSVTNQPTARWIFPDRASQVQDARWWGIVADTNVSSADALQAAFDFAAMTSATDRSKTVMIPKGDYMINRTVVIKGNVDAPSAVFHVFVPGFSATNTAAFQVGTPSLDVRHAEIHLPSVEWHGNTHADGSTSFDLREVNYSRLTFSRTFGSQYGVKAAPTLFGFAYDHVTLGQHRDHKYAVALVPDVTGSGFVNDNEWVGGSLFIPNNSQYFTAGVTEQASGYAAIFTRYGGTGGDVNNNLFTKPVIEGSGWEHLWNIEGRNNTILYARNERQPAGGASLIRKGAFYYDPARPVTIPTHYNRVIMGFMSPEHQLVVERLGNVSQVVDNYVELEGVETTYGANGMPMKKLFQKNPGSPALAFYPSGVPFNSTTNQSLYDPMWTTAWAENLLSFKGTNDTYPLFFIRATDGLLGWGPGGTNSTDTFLQRIGPDLLFYSNTGGVRIAGTTGLRVDPGRKFWTPAASRPVPGFVASWLGDPVNGAPALEATSIADLAAALGGGGGGGGVSVATVRNIAELRSSALTTNKVVLGYYTPGDWGKARLFTAQTTLTATNLGNIFGNVNSSTVFYVSEDRNETEQDCRWWGAIPTDALDDYASLQAAIDDIQKRERNADVGVRTLLLSGGTFNLHGGLTITNTITLQGVNRETTTVIYDNTTNLLTIGSSAGVQGVHIKDIRFYGNGTTNVGPQNLIYINGAQRGSIERCTFSNCPRGAAIRLDQTDWIWTIRDCVIGFCDVGIRLFATGVSGSIVAATQITGGEIAGNHWGILAGTTNTTTPNATAYRLISNLWITDTTIEANGDNYITGVKDGGGIWLNGAESVNIDGIYTELNPVDLRLGNPYDTNSLSVVSLNVKNVRFADSANGVQIYSANNAIFDNNMWLGTMSTNIVVLATSAGNVSEVEFRSGNVRFVAPTTFCPTVHDPLGVLIIDAPCGPGSGGGGAAGTVVSSIAALQALVPSPANSNVVVLGYYAQGDWGKPRTFYQIGSFPGTSATNLGHRFTSLDGGIHWLSRDEQEIMQDLRWFGAKPVPAISYTNFQAAADFCRTISIYGFPYSKTLVMYDKGGDYNLGANTLFLECSFDFSRGSILSAVTGTNAALHVGNRGTSGIAYSYTGLDCKFPADLESTVPSYNAGIAQGVGIRIEGVRACKFTFGQVNRFDVGINIRGTALESHYNNFYGGMIGTCKNGLVYDTGPEGGAANANNFWGLSITAAIVPATNYSAIYGGLPPNAFTNGFESIIFNGPAVNSSLNGIQFYGTSLEGFASSRFISFTNVSGIKFSDTRIECYTDTNYYPHLNLPFECPFIQVTATRAGVGWNNEFDFSQVVGTPRRWPWLLESNIPDANKYAGGNKLSTIDMRLFRGNLSQTNSGGLGQIYEHSRFYNEPLVSFYPPPNGINNAFTDPGRWSMTMSDGWIRTKALTDVLPRYELGTSIGTQTYYDTTGKVNFKLLNERDGYFRLRGGGQYGGDTNQQMGFSVYGYQSGQPSAANVSYDAVLLSTNGQYRSLDLGVYPPNYSSVSAFAGWTMLYTGGPWNETLGMKGIKLMSGNINEQIQMQLGFVSSPQFAMNANRALFDTVDVATTRNLNASNLVAQAITLVPTATTNTVGVNDSHYGIYNYQSANNTFMRWQQQNIFTSPNPADNIATADLNFSAQGAAGQFAIFPTNYTSGTYQGRTRIYNSANGVVNSLTGSGFPDFKIEFSTNNAFTMSAILTDIQTTTTKLKAAPGSPAFILGTVTDPQYNSQSLVTIPVSSLGGGGGIGDAPNDGNPYGRQSQSWTNLNAIYGRLAMSNYWTGSSNVFTTAINVGNNRIDPAGLIGINAPITAGLPINAKSTVAGPSYIGMQNLSTDPASYSGFYASSGNFANDGGIFAYPTVAANFANRVVLRSFTAGGAGLGIYAPYSAQTIDFGVATFSAPQVVLSATELDVKNTLKVLAPTNMPTHFAVFGSSPLTSSSNLRSAIPSDVANVLAPFLPGSVNLLPLANTWTGASNTFVNPLYGANVYATNKVAAKDGILGTVTTIYPWNINQAPIASAVFPVYSYSDTNAPLSWGQQNINTGNSAYVRLLQNTVGGLGSLYTFPSAYSANPPNAGKTLLENNNSGIVISANSGDVQLATGGGIQMVVANTLTTINTAATKLRAAVGSPTHILGTVGDPTAAALNLVTIPVGSLGGGGGITDAPLNTTTYGRSNATWVNLDLKYQGTNLNLTDISGITGANGDLIFHQSGHFTKLAAGSNGSVLTMGATYPAWSAPSGGGGISDVPNDSKYYARRNTGTGAWADLAPVFQPLNTDLTYIGGGGFNQGDILFYNSGWSRKTIGTEGQVLTVGPGNGVAWSNAPAGGGGGGTTYTKMMQVLGKAEFQITNAGADIANVTTEGIVSGAVDVGSTGSASPLEVDLTFNTNIGTNYAVVLSIDTTGASFNTVGGEGRASGGGPTHLTGSTRVWFRDVSNNRAGGGEYVRAWIVKYTDVVSGSGGAGTKSFYRFRYLDNVAPVANAAVIDTRNTASPTLVLAFDDTTDQFAVFEGVVPEGITLTSVTCRLFVAAATATTGVMKFGMALSNMETTDSDGDSWSTEATGSVTTSGTAGIGTWLTITQSNLASITGGTAFRVRIARRPSDTGTDTMVGNAQLIMGELRTQ